MFSVHTLPAPLKHLHPIPLVCSGFGSGYIKPASGTWGSALAFLLLFSWVPLLPITAKVILIILLTLIGVRAIQYLSHMMKRPVNDASWIVIDEWAGLAIAMCCAQSSIGLLLAFAFFRLFDIVKRGPVGWVDRNIHGAWGIMLDDLVAGVMAGLCVWGLEAYVL